MKQLLRWGVLASALLVVAGGTVRAQVPGQSLPATKVGIVNIGVLFTKYEKAGIYKKELENELAPLKAEADTLKKNMKGHQDWLEVNGKNPNPKDQAQAETSAMALKNGQRALEDLDLRARKLIGKKQETQLIQLYKEIHAGVQQYAQQNGYHMIFAYGDPPDQDQFTFANINRKMGGMDSGAAVPYYWQTNLDVSNEVLARLNGAYRAAGGQPVSVTPASFSPPPKQ